MSEPPPGGPSPRTPPRPPSPEQPTPDPPSPDPPTPDPPSPDPPTPDPPSPDPPTPDPPSPDPPAPDPPSPVPQTPDPPSPDPPTPDPPSPVPPTPVPPSPVPPTPDPPSPDPPSPDPPPPDPPTPRRSPPPPDPPPPRRSPPPPDPPTPRRSPPPPDPPLPRRSPPPPDPPTPRRSPPPPKPPLTPADDTPPPPSPIFPTPPTPIFPTPPTPTETTIPLSPPPPTTPTAANSSSSSISTTAVVGIAAAGAVGLIFLAALCTFFARRRNRNEQRISPPAHHVMNIPPSSSTVTGPGDPLLLPPSPALSLPSSKITFTYEELSAATDGFSEDNLLGQGGFGYVHLGTLPNGKLVAVKQLKVGSGQGEREFQAEVEIISRVHHRHLVSLVGYCIHGERRLLVYDYITNSTLEFQLHGKGRPVLEWPTRLRIALGSAKGLAYLHEDCHPKTIHRDIKASNILLDYKFEAKLADFGLARIASEGNTHVSTRVVGTLGYLAPEYASSGKLTDKSDVFSLGVVLLELISGRRPIDNANTFMEGSLVDWARPLLRRAMEGGQIDPLVDPRLQDSYDPGEMARLVACAAACVRRSARRRPRVSQVVRVLEGEVSLEDLKEGLTPGLSSVYDDSLEYGRGLYIDDMRRLRKVALGSRDNPSSEFSDPTSQYGLDQFTSSELENSERWKRETRGQYSEDMRRFRKPAPESHEYARSDFSGSTSEYGLNQTISSSEGYTPREMELTARGKKDSKGFRRTSS